MIILDTNVVSELIKDAPDPPVRAWANAQPRRALLTTSITVMELRAGVEKLLQSRRRQELEAGIEWALDELLGYIGVAEIYITAYPNKQQITSGTLAYAVGAGKARLGLAAQRNFDHLQHPVQRPSVAVARERCRDLDPDRMAVLVEIAHLAL